MHIARPTCRQPPSLGLWVRLTPSAASSSARVSRRITSAATVVAGVEVLPEAQEQIDQGDAQLYRIRPRDLQPEQILGDSDYRDKARLFEAGPFVILRKVSRADFPRGTVSAGVFARSCGSWPSSPASYSSSLAESLPPVLRRTSVRLPALCQFDWRATLHSTIWRATDRSERRAGGHCAAILQSPQESVLGFRFTDGLARAFATCSANLRKLGKPGRRKPPTGRRAGCSVAVRGNPRRRFSLTAILLRSVLGHRTYRDG